MRRLFWEAVNNVNIKMIKDTAIRGINDLIDKNIMQKEAACGRSTNYKLKWKDHE